MPNPPKRGRRQDLIMEMEIDTSVLYLTPKEVSKMVGCCVSTVTRDISLEKLKAFRMPGHGDIYKKGLKYFIHPDDADRYRQERS